MRIFSPSEAATNLPQQLWRRSRDPVAFNELRAASAPDRWRVSARGTTVLLVRMIILLGSCRRRGGGGCPPTQINLQEGANVSNQSWMWLLWIWGHPAAQAFINETLKIDLPLHKSCRPTAGCSFINPSLLACSPTVDPEECSAQTAVFELPQDQVAVYINYEPLTVGIIAWFSFHGVSATKESVESNPRHITNMSLYFLRTRFLFHWISYWDWWTDFQPVSNGLWEDWSCLCVKNKTKNEMMSRHPLWTRLLISILTLLDSLFFLCVLTYVALKLCFSCVALNSCDTGYFTDTGRIVSANNTSKHKGKGLNGS